MFYDCPKIILIASRLVTCLGTYFFNLRNIFLVFLQIFDHLPMSAVLNGAEQSASRAPSSEFRV